MVTLGTTLGLAGCRYTDPDFVLNVVWVVESTTVSSIVAPGEGVAYLIKVNGIPVATGTVTTRSITQPNFAPHIRSWMPGAPAGGLAPVEGYSLPLRMGDYAGGVIDVDAVAGGNDGSIRLLPPLRIYNDSDGVDRRPTNKEVFWDYDNGSDTNLGTSWGDAVETLYRAIELVRNGQSDCGGGTIRVRGTIVGNGSKSRGLSGTWRTSDYWPLRIIGEDIEPGVPTTWTRLNPPNGAVDTQGGDAINAVTTDRMRVFVENITFLGLGPFFAANPAVLTFGETVRLGCTWRSKFWDGSPRVRVIEDVRRVDPPLEIQSTANSQTLGSTFGYGELRQGGSIAYNAQKQLFDVMVQGMCGGALLMQGNQKSCVAHSWLVSVHNYTRNVTRGWGDSNEGTDLEIIAAGGADGSARILGPVGGVAFSTIGDSAGSSRIKIRVGGAANAANNGDFTIVGGGVTGGRHYCDYVNESAVSEAALTAGGIVRTVVDSYDYADFVHPSFCSVGTGRTEHDILRDIAHFNMTDEVQVVFLNGNDGANHDQLLLDNIRSAGDGGNISLGECNLTNSLIRRCQWAADSLLLGSAASHFYHGTQVSSCVFGSSGGDLADAITNGLDVRHCHFVTGSTYGVSPDSGTYLLTDPTLVPYIAEPTLAVRGSGDPWLYSGSEWDWSTTATAGARRNVALLDWSYGANILATVDVRCHGVIRQSTGFVRP